MNESVPQAEDAELMRLSPWDFDQTPKGWRQFGDNNEFVKAAGLISKYMEINRDLLATQPESKESIHLRLLNFHRGQMLAAAGQEHSNEAIESFKKAFGSDECWDAYVTATIGFLEGNTHKIEEAIHIIESSSQPEKRMGNIRIIRRFKKALEQDIHNYLAAYSLPDEDVT